MGLFASVAQCLDVILNKGQFLPQGALGHMGKTDRNKSIEHNSNLLDLTHEFSKVAGHKSNT